MQVVAFLLVVSACIPARCLVAHHNALLPLEEGIVMGHHRDKKEFHSIFVF